MDKLNEELFLTAWRLFMSFMGFLSGRFSLDGVSINVGEGILGGGGSRWMEMEKCDGMKGGKDGSWIMERWNLDG